MGSCDVNVSKITQHLVVWIYESTVYDSTIILIISVI